MNYVYGLEQPMSDQFQQLKKNTVNAQDQLSDSENVFYFRSTERGPRILLVGNSITLHGIMPEIGWICRCGMAASSVEKDYVHLLMNKIRSSHSTAEFCICQASEWESQYLNGRKVFDLYSKAKDFESDIIVLRIIENCPSYGFDPDAFKSNLEEFISYLDKSGKAKLVITTAFWHHPGDKVIEELAREKDIPLVLLGDLGENDSMKAIGKFAHTGVANHPGDLGMEYIAERIYSAVRPML